MSPFACTGVRMHDSLAVGVLIDRGVIRTREMRVYVEIRGEFSGVLWRRLLPVRGHPQT